MSCDLVEESEEFEEYVIYVFPLVEANFQSFIIANFNSQK
jgi:hypothetical protein